MMMHSTEELTMLACAVIALVLVAGFMYIIVTGGSDESNTG